MSLLSMLVLAVQTLNASGDLVDDPAAEARLAKEQKKLVYRAVYSDRASTSLVVRTYSNLKYNSGDDYHFDLEFRDWETDSRVVYTNTLAATYNDRWSNQSLPIGDLPSGTYNLRVNAFGPSGKRLWSRRSFYLKPDGPFPWEGNRIGIADTVPPPWTNPEFSDAGFQCWNRSAKFGGEGIVSSLVTAEHELLSAPVTLVLNDVPLKFKSSLRKAKRSEARYLIAAERADIDCACVAEFDGFMKFVVRYSGKIKSLELVIPLVRGNLAAFDDCNDVIDKRRLRTDDRLDLEYDPNAKPFWWTGNERFGLMGGVNDLRGWHLRELAKGYRLTVSPEAATFRMKIVDTEISVPKKSPRKFSFYLQATPTKPKNLKEAALSPFERRSWTGSMAEFFEVKAEGFMDKAVQAKFAREADAGKHVYWYCASQGVSPSFPLWSWFGGEWALYGDPGFQISSTSTNELKRLRGGWTWACPNSKTFLDYKVDSINWLIQNPDYRVGNLYFDLAFPKPCENEVHGCKHQDDFGNWVHDWTLYSVREFHKRIYRQLKAKDPNGVLYGHLQFQRTPSDVFFDRLAMGEVYERRLNKLPNKIAYFGILKPDDMQIQYGMRANEFTIDLIPQIYRILMVYHPERLKDYREDDSFYRTANAHFHAYVHIHNLMMYSEVGRQTLAVEQKFCELGPDAKYYSYYTREQPVSAPGLLWSLHVGNGKAILVLLNDSAQPVESEVRLARPHFAERLKLAPYESRFGFLDSCTEEKTRMSSHRQIASEVGHFFENSLKGFRQQAEHFHLRFSPSAFTVVTLYAAWASSSSYCKAVFPPSERR